MFLKAMRRYWWAVGLFLVVGSALSGLSWSIGASSRYQTTPFGTSQFSASPQGGDCHSYPEDLNLGIVPQEIHKYNWSGENHVVVEAQGSFNDPSVVIWSNTQEGARADFNLIGNGPWLVTYRVRKGTDGSSDEETTLGVCSITIARSNT